MHRFFKIALGLASLLILFRLSLIGQNASHEPLDHELKRHDQALLDLNNAVTALQNSMASVRGSNNAIKEIQDSLASHSWNGNRNFLNDQKAEIVYLGDSKPEDAGMVTVNDKRGQVRAELSSDKDGGYIIMFTSTGHDEVGALLGVANGRGILNLRGKNGLDVSEEFATDSADLIPPGSLVSVSSRGDELNLSRFSYDPSVIGIVSGAGDLKPAVTLGESRDHHSVPVAVAGQVYVRVCLQSGPINPGDLLVASSIPGVAMRAINRNLAFGAVVGKALQSFGSQPVKSDTGLVRMLVMAR